MKQKGFTLIELLVSASIIGVLMLVGIITYSNSRRKAMDAKKIEDMKDVQKTLEQYYSVEGEYPGSCLSEGDSLTTSGGTTILQSFPSPPDSTTYSGSNCDEDNYCYCAEMMIADGNSSTASCNFGGTGYYCVDARQ